jgi:hypothetical protein
MHFRVIVATLCTVWLSAAQAAAQSVDDLIARHIEARGGYEKLKAITTIRMTRLVATPFSDIRVVIYKKRPSLYRAEQGPARSDAPLVPRMVNAEGAWDVIGGKVVERPAPAAAETRELDGDFDGLLVDWKEKGHVVTYVGRERLPSGDTYKLKVRTRSGAERTIHLDATTCLERRQTGVLNLPGGRRFNVVIDFDNYRETGGVKFPLDITEERTGTEPVQSLVIYTENVEVNVPMDDALFGPPGVRPPAADQDDGSWAAVPGGVRRR